MVPLPLEDLGDPLAAVAGCLPIRLVCHLTCTGRTLRDHFRGRRNADNDGEEWDQTLAPNCFVIDPTHRVAAPILS